MNAGMSIATIVSLLLALAAAGDVTKPQAGVSGSRAASREHEMQHNETLVRDAALTSKPGGARLPWVCNHNETIVRDTSQMKKAGFGCPPWMCNHNETLLSDAAR